MSKNRVSVNTNSNTITETYSVNSRGRELVVSQSSSEPNSVGKLNLLFLICSVILIISLVRSFYGSNPITFGGLLEFLSSAPVVDLTFKNLSVIPGLSWGGILEPLANFFNFFIDIINVNLFVFKALWQVVQYLWYLLMFIFS